jgi:hypothetical protein
MTTDIYAKVDEPPPLNFSAADSERAHAGWKATCGPHAIAAACGLSLDQVRAGLPPYRGWMSPTMVEQTLNNLRRSYLLHKGLKTSNLCNGLNRVQWEGEWLKPGVPARVAYFHTHWVAAWDGWVLCTTCEPTRWIPERSWRHFHLMTEPRSPFHVTHHYALPFKPKC